MSGRGDRDFRDAFDRFEPPQRGRFGDNEYAPAPRGRVTGASDLCDLNVALHHETKMAVLVSKDGDETKSSWVPKSRIEMEHLASQLQGRRKDGRPARWPMIAITLPEGLANEKGLL